MLDRLTDKIRNAGVRINDKELYARVGSEISDGMVDPGLWTKAFADSRGDEQRARSLYIRMRVAELVAQRERLRTEREQEAVRSLTYRQIEELDAQHRRLAGVLADLKAEYRATGRTGMKAVRMALVFGAIAFVIVAMPIAYITDRILGAALMGAIAVPAGMILSQWFGKGTTVRRKIDRTKLELEQVRNALSRIRGSL